MRHHFNGRKTPFHSRPGYRWRTDVGFQPFRTIVVSLTSTQRLSALPTHLEDSGLLESFRTHQGSGFQPDWETHLLEMESRSFSFGRYDLNVGQPELVDQSDLSDIFPSGAAT